MRNFVFPLLTLILFNFSASAQMSNGRFGNEWINYDQSYLKLKIVEDGVYRLSTQELRSAGVPVDNVEGRQYQLFLRGEEHPLHLSTSGVLGGSDYIEFFGKKNRSELDRELFPNPDVEMLNPDYSLYTDTAAYFLTWNNNSSNLRYNNSTTDLSNLPAVESYCWVDQAIVYSEKQQEVKNPRFGNSVSTYGRVEGFATEYNPTNEAVIEPETVVTGGPSAKVQVRVGTKEGPHQLVVKINGVEVNSENFNSYAVKQYEFEVSAGDISNNVTVRTESLEDNDKNTLANVHLIYPRTFDFSGKTKMQFSLENGSGRRYLEIQNFDNGGGAPVIYDLDSGLRVIAQVDGNTAKFVLPAGSENRNLFLYSQNGGYQTPSTSRAVNFTDLSDDDNTDYLIISHPRLYNDGSGNNYVQQYANYRASVQGGAFQTRIVNIDELYDQFAYGIGRHPLSVRNFVHYMKQEWESTKYILLLGKGREYPFSRKHSELVDPINASYFIPTYGYPGSDNLMVAANNSNIPAYPVGRIAASTPDDIRIYLKKIQDLESTVSNAGQTIEDKAWMKNIMHLSGGGTNEQVAIANALGVMENIIENNDFGGEVTSFYKTSTDPVQISTSERIFETINNGVSLITFFGHSGVGTFDFNIDNPDNYNNFGKYPFMVSLGCYSGNIHTSSVGVSERFLFYEDKAAIAFGAATGTGFVSTLSSFAQEYYRKVGGENYGATIAEVLQATIGQFNNSTSTITQEMIHQFTIHGDPALRLNPAPGPDYVVDAASVAFEPGVVSTQLDSFDFTFDIVNIGKGVDDSLVVKLEQEFPDGTRIVPYLEKVRAPLNREPYTVKIPVYGKTSVGLNRMYVNIDVENEINEMPTATAESNNELRTSNGERGVQFYVSDNGVNPLYPSKFGIAGSSNITLISSTADPMVPEQKYILELDTTELFNSPIKIRHEIVQRGGVIKWDPSMNWQDEEVYYWRVSPDSLDPNIGYIWANSSFVYLPGEGEGWNQSHFYQYKVNEGENMVLDEGTRKYRFADNVRDFKMINKVWDPSDPPSYTNNGNPWSSPFRFTIDAGVQVIVRDGNTLQYWVNPSGAPLYGSQSSGLRLVAFPYATNTEGQREPLIDLLENIVPDGHYVVVYTVLRSNSSDFSPELWAQDSINLGTNVYQLLENQGATKIRELAAKGSVPYILVYKKGEGVIREEIGENINDVVIVEQGLTGLWFEGLVNSTIVGPASSWDRLEWDEQLGNNPENDTLSIDIYAIDNSGKDTLLFSRVNEKEIDLSSILASEYPHLRLVYNTEDDIDRTAPHLNYWRVFYEGLPDLAVNPANEFAIYADSIAQGDQFKLSYSIENISPYQIDSTAIEYLFRDESNRLISIDKKIAPLGRWSTITDEITLNTESLKGKQVVSVNLNSTQEQVEKSYQNNFLQTNFFVEQDQRNPILDVTFDGQHIMNGDVISPQPEIYISLKDENPYLILDDTSVFRVFLNLPDGGTEKISMTDPRIVFLPASSTDNNRAALEFRPNFGQDGLYELLVQAEDATGNQSGDFDYKVSFEVVNKQSLSNVLNYPNPFSTSTRFVYTLTGNEVPIYFKIRIMTVSGKVIREITQDELGPLKIGTHQTDFVWDGTDQFGDKLANGVYLYQVVAKNSEGNEFDVFTTSADKYFKNGIGKMVILR